MSLFYWETYLFLSVWYFQLNFSPKNKGSRHPIKLNTEPTAFSILLVFCVMLKGTSSCLKLSVFLWLQHLMTQSTNCSYTSFIIFSYQHSRFYIACSFHIWNYWNLVLDIEDVKQCPTVFLPFYLGGINNEQKEFQMFFESATYSSLQPMNTASLTSLYIQVREETPFEAESVHTTAESRATAVKSPGKGERLQNLLVYWGFC